MGLCDSTIGWSFSGLAAKQLIVNANGLIAWGAGLSVSKNIFGGDPDNISIATPALGLTASVDVTLISIKYQGTATQSPININLGGTLSFHDILGGSVTVGYHPPSSFEFSLTAGGGMGAGFKGFQVGGDIKH